MDVFPHLKLVSRARSELYQFSPLTSRVSKEKEVPANRKETLTLSFSFCRFEHKRSKKREGTKAKNPKKVLLVLHYILVQMGKEVEY